MNKYMGYEFRESMAFSHKTKKLHFFLTMKKKHVVVLKIV